MAEKLINVNLRLTASLWARLLTAAGNVGHGRAAFIRMVLEGAAYSKDPSVFVPRKAQGWMQPVAAPPRADPRPEPEPEPEEEPDEEYDVPYDPNYYYQHWRKVGRTHEEAMDLVRPGLVRAGIADWQPPENGVAH
jgi:hypothetical protein